MHAYYSDYEIVVKRNATHSEWRPAYHGRMGDRGIGGTLWDNVAALMLKRYGEENINRLARDAKIGPATVQGIKDGNRSVRLNTLEKIAKSFGIEPWQLIARGMDDEKFLEILTVWQETDGRGRRMLLTAAEGAKTTDETAAAPSERAAKAKRG